MTDVYIDPSTSVNGIGTISSPYTGFAEVNAWTGDQGGAVIYIKGGTLSRNYLRMTATPAPTNYSVMAYGYTGAKPVIKGSTIPTNWIKEGVLWYLSLDPYDLSLISIRQLNVFWNAWPMNYVASKGALVPGMLWFDSPNNRIYAYLDNTTDANLAGLEVATTQMAVILQGGLLIARDLHVMHSWDTAFQLLNLVDGTQLTSIDVEYGGSPTGYHGRNCFEISGTRSPTGKAIDAVVATNIRVRSCTTKGAENNGMELWALDGAVFEDITSYGNFSNEFELWQKVQNCTFNRIRIYGDNRNYRTKANHIARFFSSAAASPESGLSSGNVFKNSIFVAPDPNLSIPNMGVSSAVIVERSCDNNKFYNNTFINWGAASTATFSGTIALGMYTTTASVTSSSTTTTVNASALTQAAAYWNGGQIFFSTGPNAGTVATIASSISGVLTISPALIATPGIGDAFRVYEQAPLGTQFKGNIVATNRNERFVSCSNGATMQCADNIWFNTVGYATRFNFGGTDNQSLAAWNTAMSGNDIGSNPLLNADYTLQAGSPAINLAASLAGVVKDDLVSYARYENPDSGCYEKRIMSPVTTILHIIM